MSLIDGLLSNVGSRFKTVSKALEGSSKAELFNLPDLVYPETLSHVNEGNTSLIMFTVLEVGGIDAGNLKNINKGFSSEQESPVVGRRIYLYMPETVSNSTSSNWQLDELGVVGRIGDALGNKSGGFIDNVKKFAGSAGDSAIRGGSKFASNVTGVNVSGARKLKAKKIINPFMELLFENVDNRQFNFNFVFIPKNPKEAEDVRNIIKVFRLAASPSFSGGNRSFIRYPNTFNIKYIDAKSPNGDNKWLPKIGNCALTDINTNYSGSGQYATHHDGSPKEIHLALQFTELKWLDKSNIEDGF